MEKRIPALIVAGLISFSPVSLAAKDAIRDAVVKIHVTQRPPDYYRPWTKATSRKTSGTGVIIAGRRILTNAHVALYASQIFVQPDQSTDRIPASVIAISPEMDLAVLRLEDESLFDDRSALALATAVPAVKDTVNVYGYPIGGDDMSVTEGIVSRIEYAAYYHDAGGLRVQVDAPLNPGNSGGPAIMNGEITGLVFSKMIQAENIGYLIPAEEVASFLEDIDDGKVDGKPTLFDQLQTTENEALRARLGLTKELGGVLVRRPYGRDPSYPLRVWDVITRIGTRPIDSRGKVRIDDELRLSFKYLIPRLAHDGLVALTIFRHGETIEVEVPVRRRRELLLPSLRGAYPRYFIHGPVVFTRATQEFVNGMGVRGRVYLSAVESPLITRQFDRPSRPGEELVVMANRMFPHRVIKGYANMPFGVITRVNGRPVENLRHLVTLLRDAKGPFMTLNMAGSYETLVFRRGEIEASTEEILEEEGIRYRCSADLRDIWPQRQ